MSGKLNGWSRLVSLNSRSGIKGKENKVADALSRRIHVNHIIIMNSYGGRFT